jgi:hypothetical protein
MRLSPMRARTPTMTRHFTHYWANATWHRTLGSHAGSPLDHCASSLFLNRGVRTGDCLYVVTVRHGRLLLGARMRVTEITNRPTARRRLGADVWDAPDHAFGEAGTPLRHDLTVPDAVVKNLRFAPSGSPLRFVGRRLDQQTLRGVRELTPGSAALLDQLLEAAPSGSFHLPEELPSFAEGKGTRIVVNTYERDARARAECIQHHGVACCVCGLSMETAYGALGRGFIHVHHLQPLSQAEGQREVVPSRDLRPVCPNCHAMLHRSEDPADIEGLKRIVRQHQRRP